MPAKKLGQRWKKSHQNEQRSMSFQRNKTIIRILSSLKNLIAIYVHGSTVKGTAHKGSDIDLALLFETKSELPTGISLLKLASAVENELGRPIHIGILSANDVVFAKEVICYGKRIFCRDGQKCDSFEMLTLSFYAALNESRKAVIDAYHTAKEI